MSKKPVIGVSSCLMGHNVRFDGGHKRDRLITDVLAEYMDVKTFCPEMGIGLGTPRPTIRLQEVNNETRLVNSKKPRVDYTSKMVTYSKQTVDGLSHFDGFIFKKGSPSCGAFRVPVVIHKDGHRRHDGTGLFAKAFMERYPWIPIEEEGRLNDANLRQNFFERVYALRRWHDIADADHNITEFINFHAAHKLMLMARSQVEYRSLGRWVAETTPENLKERRHVYLKRFMLAMKNNITNGCHINVMMHIMGYLKNKITRSDKQELLLHFESFRQNHLPLTAVILLLRHHLRKHPIDYLERQHYLKLYPLNFVR